VNQPSEILQFETPVLLVGPADVDFHLLGKLARRGFVIVAADGGGNSLAAKGIIADAIIGDFDSLDASIKPASQTRLIKLEEQDSTDFEKCLNAISAPLFLAFGFTGRRFDHTLATLHAMVKYHGDKNVLLFGGEDISFVHRGNFSLKIGCDERISLIALEAIEFSGCEGLEYSLIGMKFEFGKKISTSNRSTSETVKIFPSAQYQNTPYVVVTPNSSLELLLKQSW